MLMWSDPVNGGMRTISSILSRLQKIKWSKNSEMEIMFWITTMETIFAVFNPPL